MAQIVKSPPAMQETQVQSLDREDPLEKGMATHSSFLAWRIPWTEEPGGVSMGSQELDVKKGLTHTFILITSPHCVTAACLLFMLQLLNIHQEQTWKSDLLGVGQVQAPFPRAKHAPQETQPFCSQRLTCSSQKHTELSDSCSAPVDDRSGPQLVGQGMLWPQLWPLSICLSPCSWCDVSTRHQPPETNVSKMIWAPLKKSPN